MTDKTTFEDIPLRHACLLQVRADRAVRAAVNTELRAYHLTMMEWLLLGVIYDASKDGLSMSALATSLQVTMPQVTALVGKLVQQKLVRQKSQRRDRRLRCVMITGKGRNFIDELEDKVRQSAIAWLQPIPRERMRTYLEILAQLGDLAPLKIDQPTGGEQSSRQRSGLQLIKVRHMEG